MTMFGTILLAATCVCGLDHEVTNERSASLWSGATVRPEQISDALSLDGFKSRTLYTAGDLDFYAEIDEKGDGTWTKAGLKKRSVGVYDLKYLACSKFRIVANKAATNVTAVVNLANPSVRPFDAPVQRKPVWEASAIKAGEPSDPVSIHGLDEKCLSVSSDNGAKITVELDITGTGVWIPFRTLKTADRLNVSNLRAYRLRAVADRDCKATVLLEYK